MNEELLQIMDILGTFAFACSGAFSAMNKRLDPVGVVILAFITAIGVGTLRDVLIGNFPVSWLQNEMVITVIIIACIASMLGKKYLKKMSRTLFIFDAIGLGLFTIYGIELGLANGFSMGICIALGTITACFGGVIRDVSINNVPLIFHKEIYAMVCVVGGLLYFLLDFFQFELGFIRITCILFIIIIRILVYSFQLSIPKFYEKKLKK